MPTSYTLYSYYGSTCSQRVRIGLALKGITPEWRFVNLLKDEQNAADYVARVNPSHSVPTLIVTDSSSSSSSQEEIIITQSLAILEFLDETVPDTAPLLPPASEHVGRARVRALANIIACDVQPVTNLRIVNRLKSAGSHDVNAWQNHFMSAGFAAYERVAATTAGAYSYGDSVTLADCALLPAVHRAGRFGVDLAPYPTIRRVVDNLERLDAFRNSSWRRQPDTPAELREKASD